jgi:hypothetical protein
MAQSNTWYVGKGLQPDSYYTYRIQEHDTNQGRIAAIGGQTIAPTGSAKITVPAGSFDTVAVNWHYGEDNHTFARWINLVGLKE